jgi:hypothetical protein
LLVSIVEAIPGALFSYPSMWVTVDRKAKEVGKPQMSLLFYSWDNTPMTAEMSNPKSEEALYDFKLFPWTAIMGQSTLTRSVQAQMIDTWRAHNPYIYLQKNLQAIHKSELKKLKEKQKPKKKKA